MTNKFKANGKTLEDLRQSYGEINVLPGNEQILACENTHSKYFDVYCNGSLVARYVDKIGYTASIIACQLYNGVVQLYNIKKHKIISSIEDVELLDNSCGTFENKLGYIIIKGNKASEPSDYTVMVIEDSYGVIKHKFKSPFEIKVYAVKDEIFIQVAKHKAVKYNVDTFAYRIEII